MTQKLKRGDKVIVARSQAFTTQRRPRLAVFWRAFPEWTVAVMFDDHDHPVHFHATDVAPYSDAPVPAMSLSVATLARSTQTCTNPTGGTG